MGFSAASYTQDEGKSVLVTVKRTGGTASGATVDYATAPGTATFPADYGVPTGTGRLTFNSGELSKTFSVPLVAEAPVDVEGPEAFQVVLSNPTGGATVGPLGSATININDLSPRVTFSAATATVSEALTTLAINVMRSGPTTTAVTVPYFTTDGSATAVAVLGNPADYTAASGNLVIPVGATSKAITLVLKVDTVAEGPENLTVHLGTPIGGELGAISIVTVNITDNDFGGAVAFSAASFSVQEPLTGALPVKATVTVKRTGGTASGVIVPWSTSDGTATAALDDYTPVTSGSLTFDAGVTSKTFTVDVLPDAVVEGNEAFTVTLGVPTGGATPGTPNTASIKILDSEPVVQFSPLTVTIGEAGPKATFTVKRTGVLTGAPLTVSIVDLTGPAGATFGSDYNNVPGSLVIPTGAATKTFTVDILQDAFQELPETVILGLSSCTPGCTVDPPSANATLTITDDEPLVSFDRIIPYTVVEGTAKATFTLKRTGSTVSALTVNIADLLNGTATAGVDYTNVPAQVVIPAKATSKTFTIDILNDLDAESTETVQLAITAVSAPGFIGTVPNATLNLADNEPSIAFALGFANVNEPLNTTVLPTKHTVVVKRTGTLTQVSTVRYEILDGTATVISDYLPFNPGSTAGILTFASGVASVNLVIDILADAADEGASENFTITLYDPTASKLGATVTATRTIVDND